MHNVHVYVLITVVLVVRHNYTVLTMQPGCYHQNGISTDVPECYNSCMHCTVYLHCTVSAMYSAINVHIQLYSTCTCTHVHCVLLINSIYTCTCIREVFHCYRIHVYVADSVRDQDGTPEPKLILFKTEAAILSKNEPYM